MVLIVNEFFYCGGILIVENWVVIVVYCVYNRYIKKFFLYIRVYFGVYDIKFGLREFYV